MAALRLIADLPRDRTREGKLAIFDAGGEIVAGPWRCRGKADSAAAASVGNPSRDSTKRYGDHPYGRYLIVRAVPVGDAVYGSHFLALDPVDADAGTPELDGDAARAEANGRSGIGIHAGRTPAPGAVLTATHGCLRVLEDALASIVPRVQSGELRDYECREAMW